MNGPEYGHDPVGPSFEPDLMLQAKQSGTPDETLKTRAWALSTSPGLLNPLTALTN